MKKFQRSHHLFPLFSHLCILTCLSFVSCRCPEHQKSAVLNLFSNRSSLPSWKADGSDCCEWEGITCDDASGHVIALDVTNRNIVSDINSSALTSLGSLRFLDLSNNDFSFSMIPSNLDCLSNLSHLNLSNAGFTGQIPVAIARMTKLVVLDISTLTLELEKPSLEVLLRNLSRLTKLHLDGVKISSRVPHCLSNLTDLTSLRLSDCELVGEFPASIFQMLKLETLDVSANWLLNGSFPDFPRESALQTLTLAETWFSGSLPYSFRNLRNLTYLDICGCEFSGPITSLSDLTVLEYLDLSSNHFSGQIPPSLVNLTRLAALKLQQNSFSGWIPPLYSLKSITVINLSSNNLTGEIPNSSGDGLLNLGVLDLSSNSLHGKIPSHLFTLPFLRSLFLSQNQLDGELHELGNASSTLEAIDLVNNKLQGQIPVSIFGFRRLRHLDLSFNRFNGSINFAKLPRIDTLEFLGLSGNSLVVNSDVDSSPFPHLQFLLMSSCNLTQFPDFLRTLSNMVKLDLSNNQIVGEIPSWIWKVRGGILSYLNLAGNLLTSLQQPNDLSFMISLETLDLHSNQLQGELPVPPGDIVVLDYSKNNFTSTIPSEFASALGHAQFFSISGNNVSGEIPPSICDAVFLRGLDLSDNSLRGSIPNCLTNFIALEVLDLKNNRLTGVIPNILSSQPCSLKTLKLNGNQLEGRLPEYLSHCGELEVLDVGNNRFRGPFPYHLNILSSLRILVLRSNNFSGSLSQLCSFSTPQLQIIDVSSNNFSGSLPHDCFSGLNALMSGEDDEDAGLQQHVIGSYVSSGAYYQDTVIVTTKGLQLELVKIMTIFRSLDLSNNKLEGEIPREIGALKLLRVLNMSHNYLEGQIPASIGNVTQLESFDLSRNQLYGRIPLELNSLTFLEVLNLSYNQLVGSIPTGPQFSTFNNDSFTGNPELCGLPLSRKCENSSAPEDQGCALKSKMWVLDQMSTGCSYRSS